MRLVAVLRLSSRRSELGILPNRPSEGAVSAVWSRQTRLLTGTGGVGPRRALPPRGRYPGVSPVVLRRGADLLRAGSGGARPPPGPPVLVKNSICLSCLNFPHPLHRRSGRVSVQAVMSDAGVPHALRARSLDAPPRHALRVGDYRAREPGSASSTRRSSTVRAPTPPVTLGPDPLGLALPPVDGMALEFPHRPARDRVVSENSAGPLLVPHSG
jgi:hypothetical protein